MFHSTCQASQRYIQLFNIVIEYRVSVKVFPKFLWGYFRLRLASVLVIITVCDRVRESCSVFPGDPKHIHPNLPIAPVAASTSTG
jgi:hypothetical protein